MSGTAVVAAAAVTAVLACAVAVALLGAPAAPGAAALSRGAAGGSASQQGVDPWPSRAELDADAAWVERRFEVDRSRSREPERLSNLGAEQASRYIRSGRPFIVTDVVQAWEMRDWDCESVRRDFGNEEMQLWNSYGGVESGQPARVRLSDPWQQWLFPQEGAAEDADEHEDEDEGAEAESCADGNNGTASPSALSFHWYALNGGAGASPDEPVFGASPQSIRRLQAAYALPSFLPQESTLNQRFCKVRRLLIP